MLTYFILFIYIILLGIIMFIKNNKSKKQKKIYLILAFIPMFFIMGFRNVSVGTDTKLYYYLYQYYNQQSFSYLFNHFDNSFLYTLYNLILGKIFSSPQTIIFFNSFIILSLTARFIYKYSNHVVISTILFFECYHYFLSFNIARQYIALLIVANGFELLLKKDLKKYIFICIIASLFHATSLIMLTLTPLFLVKAKNFKFIEFFYIILLILIFVFFTPLFNLFIKIFPHYSIYLDYNEITKNRKWIITLFYLFYSILYYYLRRKKILNIQENLNLYYLNIINITAVIIGLISLHVNLFTRVSYFFSIYLIIFIPLLLDKIYKSKDRFLFYTITLCAMLIPMVILLLENNSGILPYENIVWMRT